MSPLEAVVLVMAIVVPVHWLIQRELAKAGDIDPRECGIVIVLERALDAHAPSIGEYMGHEIWRTVTFHGLTYDFARIESPKRREKLAPGELFLDPGLVYTARLT
jgi:hypothetical protein